MRNKFLLGHNQKLLIQRKSDVIFIYLFMFLMCFVVALMEETFFTSLNIRNVINASVSLCVAAFAQLLIVLLGGVDLSVFDIMSSIRNIKNTIAIVI